MTQLDILDEIVISDEQDPSDLFVDEHSWGYVIRSGLRPTRGTQFAQGISYILGSAFAVAALGLLVLPVLFFGSEVTAFSLGGTALFAAMSAYLLWFASRGDTPIIYVDLANREIREIIENRMGGPTVLGVHPFDRVDDIFAASEEGSDIAQLVLWNKGSDEVICLAQALPRQLVDLRDRIVADLV